MGLGGLLEETGISGEDRVTEASPKAEARPSGSSKLGATPGSGGFGLLYAPGGTVRARSSGGWMGTRVPA